LTEAGVETADEINAKKTTLGHQEALELARRVDRIFAAKGSRVVHVNLHQERPDEAALASLLLGPTGNLRAPTLRIGRTLVVGFHPEMYQQAFA